MVIKTCNGPGGQHSVICAEGAFHVVAFDPSAMNDMRVVESFPYEGWADRRAALAMAKGNAASRAKLSSDIG